MATKLKKFSYSRITKLIAYILVIIMLTGVGKELIMTLRSDNLYFESVFVENYIESTKFNRDMRWAYNEVVLYYDHYYNYAELEEIQKQKLNEIDLSKRDQVEKDNVDRDREEDNEIDIVEDSINFEINMKEAYNQLEYYSKPINEAKYYYLIRTGDDILSNVSKEHQNKSYFEQFGKSFIEVRKNRASMQWISDNPLLDVQEFYNVGERNHLDEFYLAFPNEYIEELEKNWEVSRSETTRIFTYVSINLIAAFILIIYLTVVTGRKTDSKEIELVFIDKIYTDIQVILAFFIFLIPLWVYEMLYFNYGYVNHYFTIRGSSGRYNYYMAIMGISLAIVFTLEEAIYLSFVRKLKARTFIKSSILYKTGRVIFSCIKRVIGRIRSLFDGSKFKNYPITKSLYYRQLIFIVSSMFMVLFTILLYPIAIVFIILEFVLVFWYIKYNNISYEAINNGFNESFEEKMKAERMKIDLVTNVSHDLKTPLTSIISYVDLLSKEELDDTARDYVNIIEDKSNSLKNIVSDLFDLAKSTSGDIQLELEVIDIKKLIEQTIGDMDDDIIKSGLELRVSLPEEPVNIYSDGKKLYRVFQNLIGNTLKYSLEGTRVYVDLFIDNNRAVATVKNISAYEMNFTAEEVLQRFNRGDKARTSEGSGLGLSIAESFTKVCGGDFALSIDGDMFKVTMTFMLNSKL